MYTTGPTSIWFFEGDKLGALYRKLGFYSNSDGTLLGASPQLSEANPWDVELQI